MEDSDLLQSLENLAHDLGIEVRYDDLEGPGGLCRYGGRQHLIIDRSLDAGARARMLAASLARLPLDDVFIRPQVREWLERYLPAAADDDS